jgi:hypothetical protein
MTKKKKTEGDFHLDMPFEEAFERFIGVDPDEMYDNIAKSKTKKPPGEKKRKPGSKSPDTKNVVQLRDKRKPNKA